MPRTPLTFDDVTRLANEGTANDSSIEQWFFKDNHLVSARDLDDWAPI